MKYKNWINYSKKIAYKYNINEKYFELILSNKINRSIEYIFNNDYKILSKSDIDILEKNINKLILGFPINYIIKKKIFWSIEFEINKKVFIPRNETECLINFVLNNININHEYKILDLCSGCGVISISLSNELKNSLILGSDISNDAILLSNKNKKKLSINNNVNFIYSDLFKKIKKKYDIIISNPPYISINEFNNYNYKILFDPINSIISYPNSLSIINKIIKKSKKYLNNNGILIIEHGNLQYKYVKNIFIKNRFKKVINYKDYNNLYRFTVGKI